MKVLVKGRYAKKDLQELTKGQRACFIDDGTGEKIMGSIRIREVMCGKKCKKCPHKVYAYLRYRKGKRIKEKYLGIAR